MQIGETIRTYRKALGMTQEEMANRLGVTAPAVNKWEKGNSLPDVTLLPPIARLLHISLDTLLSFQEELTEEEIVRLVVEMDERLKRDPYEDVFQWAKGILETYPNCHRLFCQVALILDAWRMAKRIPDDGRYEKYFCSCYIQALESEDEAIRIRAAGSLYGYYVRNEQYEKAEAYLAYYSERDPERKRKQAEIYSRTGRAEEAYRAYEELLFEMDQMTCLIFNSIYTLAMQEKDMEKARLMVKKQQGLAALFEMGEYQEWVSGLDLAAAESDAEAAVKIAGHLLSGLDGMDDFHHSPLYEHVPFQPLQNGVADQIRRTLLEGFRNEEMFSSIREDKRWQEFLDAAESAAQDH